MSTGADFISLAKKHLHEQYVLGAFAPKNNPNWRGPWDCAEFASWVVFQRTQRLYGCSNNSGNPATADAYTGFWLRDVNAKVVQKVSVSEASQRLGALLLRNPSANLIGHIAFVAGKNKTIEAHSRATGVIEKGIIGRRWDCGILIPGVEYAELPPPPPSPILTIYRLTDPPMRGAKVREIQSRLKSLGFDPGGVDGVFGPMTAAAVHACQIAHGVASDGEVGTVTAGILGIRLS